MHTFLGTLTIVCWVLIGFYILLVIQHRVLRINAVDIAIALYLLIYYIYS